MNYSYSKIIAYAKCPRFFKARYIDKIKTAGSKELTVGSVIHNIIKKYTLECFKQKRTNLFDLWETIAFEVMREHSILPEYDKDILDGVKSFVEANEIELEGLAGVEEQIAIDDHFNQIEYFSDKAWFRLVIDKLYLLEDFAKITDYKTGFSLEADRFQIEIYAWILYKIFPHLERIQGEFDYTRFGHKETFEIPKDEIGAIEKRVLNRIKQMDADKDFKPCVGSDCDTCPFWEKCEAIKETDVRVVYPTTKAEAQILLEKIITIDKALKEFKQVLKGYTQDNGSITLNDIIAQNKVIKKTSYDMENLFKWAKKENKDLFSCLSVDNKKAKKLDIPDILKKYALSTRFTVGKNKEDSEE